MLGSVSQARIILINSPGSMLKKPHLPMILSYGIGSGDGMLLDCTPCCELSSWIGFAALDGGSTTWRVLFRLFDIFFGDDFFRSIQEVFKNFIILVRTLTLEPPRSPGRSVNIQTRTSHFPAANSRELEFP